MAELLDRHRELRIARRIFQVLAVLTLVFGYSTTRRGDGWVTSIWSVPACGVALQSVHAAGVAIFGCGGCGGHWLDNAASKRVVEHVQTALAVADAAKAVVHGPSRAEAEWDPLGGTWVGALIHHMLFRK